MSDQFDACLSFVLGQEGGLSEDPRDPGNWTGGSEGVGVLRGTNFGISAKSFPTLDIRNMTVATAGMIYRNNYWLPIAGAQLPGPIALMAMDCAVLQGVSVARLVLQSALGVAQDGIIGPQTVAAANRQVNSFRPIVTSMCVARLMKEVSLPTFTTFGRGWAKRLFDAAQASEGIGV